jgi:hypothetical protein
MSHKPSRLQLANTIISCAIPGGVFEHEDEPYRGFGCGISIPYGTAQQYIEARQSLFEEERTLPLTITMASFENLLASFIAPYVLKKTKPDTADVTAFLQEVLSYPVRFHNVLRPLAGVTLTRENKPVVLGPFRIYSTAGHSAQLEIVSGILKVPKFRRRETAFSWAVAV